MRNVGIVLLIFMTKKDYIRITLDCFLPFTVFLPAPLRLPPCVPTTKINYFDSATQSKKTKQNSLYIVVLCYRYRYDLNSQIFKRR